MAKDDLISKNDLLLSLAEYVNSNAYLNQTALDALLMVMRWVQETPAVDAVPVVHGRWVKANGMMPPEYHGRKCCSVCDAFALSDFYGRERLSDFCPNCGAKMDGGADDGEG